MTRKLVVANAAKQDLVEIGEYTERTWGHAQKQRYLEQISKRFAALRENPNIGSPRNDIRAGYRVLRSGRHLIFYLTSEDTIEIVRILHDRMDIRSRLDL